ncbi:MAG: dihydroneopterin aldolase [Desulfurobacteriaceae bacterium]
MLKTSVFIEDLKLFVKCGVFEEERNLGLEVLIDVKVEAKDFIDYQELFGTIVDVAKGKFIYLEDFGKDIIEKIKSKWKAEKISIRISKLSVPFQNSFKRAGIEIIWEGQE